MTEAASRRKRFTKLTFPLLLFLALPLASACSKPYEASSDQASGRVLESYEDLTSAHSRVTLVVFDDVASPEGDAMREAIADTFRKRDFFGCKDDLDEDDHDPLDEGLVLVPASTPDAASHPGNSSSLLLRASDAEPLVEGYRQAIVEATLGKSTETAAAPRYIEALKSWVTLLTGERKPKNAEEKAFVALYPDPAKVAIMPVVYGLREDAASDSFDSLSDLVNEGRLEPPAINVWQDLGENDRCDEASSHVDQIPKSLRPLVEAFGGRVGECSSSFADNLVGCFPYCIQEPLFTDTNQARCVVSALIDPDESCERPGWSAPESPDDEFEEFESGKRRRCDVRQLEGKALESCRTDPLCAECEPGFCIAEEATQSKSCVESGTLPVRFPEGTDVGNGMLRVTCALPDRTP